MKCLYIPRYINENYILIWKRDQLLPIFLPFILSFSGFWGGVLALILAIIISQIMKNVSHNKPNGYLHHWVSFNAPKVFVNGIFSRNMVKNEKDSLFFRRKCLPPSHIRYIAG